MWVTRLLLFIGEYGGLILSLISPLIAYLLHLDRRSLPEKEKKTFKDVWLEHWVKFREKLKEKGLTGQLIIVITTLILAFGLTPLINRVFGLVRMIWERTAVAYPYSAVRLGALVLLFIVALVLF